MSREFDSSTAWITVEGVSVVKSVDLSRIRDLAKGLDDLRHEGAAREQRDTALQAAAADLAARLAAAEAELGGLREAAAKAAVDSAHGAQGAAGPDDLAALLARISALEQQHQESQHAQQAKQAPSSHADAGVPHSQPGGPSSDQEVIQEAAYLAGMGTLRVMMWLHACKGCARLGPLKP